jgi:DNA segregation ATPase FtsK/SpoIIIE, S-DNA-T family
MKPSTPSVVAAALIAILALFLTISLLLAMQGGGNGLSYPGFLLLSGFRYVAWYLPLYLFFAAVLVILDEFKPLLLYIGSSAVVPVATAGFWLQILGEPPRSKAAEAFLTRFGSGGGSFILFLILLLELSIIYLLALKFLLKGSGDGEDGAEIPKGSEKGSSFFRKSVPSSGENSEIPGEQAALDGEAAGKEDDEVWWEEFRRRREENRAEAELSEVPFLSALNEEPSDEISDEVSAGGNALPDENDPDQLRRVQDVKEAPSEAWFSPMEDEDEDEDDEEVGEDPVEETVDFNLKELRSLSSEADEIELDLDDPEDDLDEFDEGDEFYDVDGDEDDNEDADGEMGYNSGPGFDTSPSPSSNHGPSPIPSPSPEEPLSPSPKREEQVEKEAKEKREPRIVPKEATTPEVAKNVERGIANYGVPKDKLLDEYPDSKYWVIDEPTRQAAEILKETLKEFKIQAEVTGIRRGPVITMFEILPAPGVKLSKIVNLADNIALRLAASRVRIVAPIPGKHAVGIEVPNRKRSLVGFREMIDDENFGADKMEVPVVLGKDITGEAQIVDLVQTPHLLIAGATGSGKSVCVNSIICSILYKRSPQEVNLILIDPKIVELKLYNDIPHLLTPVITEAKKAFQALQYCLYEMERRYALLDSQGVRDIRSYNRKVKKKRLATRPLPYLVVIIDEFADLMATTGKELESTLARLAAMSRAVGIHIVLATQRPSIDVITGLIKANIPSRIAFMVAGKFDSRIIIDAVGAEKLLGRGDMLFTSAWDPVPIRIQGAFLSEDEVERITDYVKTLGEPEYIDDEIFIDDDGDSFFDSAADGEDPMMDKALEIVATAGKASASYLQRRLKVGYNRAARLVEEMEERGIVGPQNGSKPRELIHMPDRFRETGESSDSSTGAAGDYPDSGDVKESGDET